MVPISTSAQTALVFHPEGNFYPDLFVCNVGDELGPCAGWVKSQLPISRSAFFGFPGRFIT